MAKKNDALFEESSRGAVGAATAVSFVFAVLFAFGGLVLASYGFDPALGGAGIWIFGGGLGLCILGFAIPFTYAKASRK